MDNLAQQLSGGSTHLDSGRVTLCRDKHYAVETDLGPVSALRSLGCLLEPEPGDTVLLALDARGKNYILTVLERENQSPATVSAPGDMRIRAANGSLDLAANQGVNLLTPETASVTARELAVTAARAEVSLDKASFFSRILNANTDACRFIGRTVEQIAGNMVQRFTRCVRKVEELDQTRAGTADYQGEQLMNLRGGQTVMTAKETVRVDGERILMG